MLPFGIEYNPAIRPHRPKQKRTEAKTGQNSNNTNRLVHITLPTPSLQITLEPTKPLLLLRCLLSLSLSLLGLQTHIYRILPHLHRVREEHGREIGIGPGTEVKGGKVKVDVKGGLLKGQHVWGLGEAGGVPVLGEGGLVLGVLGVGLEGGLGLLLGVGVLLGLGVGLLLLLLLVGVGVGLLLVLLMLLVLLGGRGAIATAAAAAAHCDFREKVQGGLVDRGLSG